MLHWEDFGASNARRILDRYADQVCTFNDDMQGTAAVVLAAAFSAVRAAGSRMRDQRVVIHGAGTAGLGIADMMRDQMVREGLSREEATRRFYPTGQPGTADRRRQPAAATSRCPMPGPAEEVGRLGGPTAEASASGRRGRPGAADDADRHVNPGRSVHRGDRAGHGCAYRRARSSCRCRTPRRKAEALPGICTAVDRWTGADRNGQPVRAGRPERHEVSDRAGQQRAGLPRPRARRDRRAGRPGSANGMIAAAADAVAQLSDATASARRCCLR